MYKKKKKKKTLILRQQFISVILLKGYIQSIIQ